MGTTDIDSPHTCTKSLNGILKLKPGSQYDAGGSVRCVASVTNYLQFDWLDAGKHYAVDTGIELVSIPVSTCAGDAR